MLSNGRSAPRAVGKEPRAGETDDVCVNLVTYVTQSVGPAYAQYSVCHKAHAHAVQQPIHQFTRTQGCKSECPSGKTVCKQGDPSVQGKHK